VLYNIGLNEGQSFRDIVNGDADRYTDMTDDDAVVKNQYLYTYCSLIIQQYTRFRNYKKEGQIPAPIQKIMKTLKISNDIPETMPDIAENFINNYYAINSTNPPKITANFLLDFLANALITIYTASPTKLGNALAKYFMDTILESEQRISAVETDQVVTKDTEWGNDADFHPVMTEQPEDESVDAQPDMFSMDSFDMNDEDFEDNYKSIDDYD
jgi:hypothetical protein